MRVGLKKWTFSISGLMRRMIRAWIWRIRPSSVDRVILAPFVAVVMGRDGLAVDLPHEARFLAAVFPVEADQVLAEGRLEHVGDDEDRCLDLETGEGLDRRQARSDRP